MSKHYVTFQQAVFLKEIGFNVNTSTCFHSLLGDVIEAPMDWDNDRGYLVRPEQHEVVEWIRINYGIWIGVEFLGGIRVNNPIMFNAEIRYIKEVPNLIQNINGFHTPQQAYSAAFDYIKDNNLIKQ